MPAPTWAAAVLGLLVYLNSLHSPFVYDDFFMIVENPALRDLGDVRSLVGRNLTRPIVNLSYAVDTVIWGRIPLAYHVTNVLLHALNTILVYWVVVLVSGDRRRHGAGSEWTLAPPAVIAFVAAAVFAVHPMMTQAVGYISARSEVVYSALFLLAFLAGRRWMLGGGRRWWVACMGLWAAGMLTKESAVMLPAVLLAYDWIVLDTPSERRRRCLRLELPMLVVALLAGAGRIAVLALVEHPNLRGPSWSWGLLQVDVLWRYVALFFLPYGQSIFHAIPPIDGWLSVRAIGAWLGLAALPALIWTLRRRHSLAAFGLLWFVLLLVPSALLYTLGRGEAMAEHRAYLAAAGLFLTWGYVAGGAWARERGSRPLVAVAALVLLLTSLATLTVVRNIIWQDPVALATEAVRGAPHAWLPRVLLAETLRHSGRCPEAVAEYRTAITIRPGQELAYNALARCLVLERRLGEADQALRLLRIVKPDAPGASMWLGVVALLDGRLDEARALFLESLARAPDPQAGRLLAFVNGTLPAPEHQRVCEDLRIVTGSTSPVGACQADASQHHRDSPPGSVD